MSRKRSAYHRKRLAQPQNNVRDGMEWMYTILRSRPFSDEVLPGALVSTQQSADRARNEANAAFGALVRGAWAANDTDSYDLLARVVGVTAIRCFQIGGEHNPYRATTEEANKALQACRARWERTGKWGATRPEQIAIGEALEVYEAVLQASSPAQMSDAMAIRIETVLKVARMEHSC